MTAITFAYAHAYQETCLARHMPGVPRLNFRLPKLKARYPYLPNDRPTTRTRGTDFRGWAQVTGVFVQNVEEVDLARIALSCHFLFLIYSATKKVRLILHTAPWSVSILVSHHCHPVTSRFLNAWYLVYSPSLRQQ